MVGVDVVEETPQRGKRQEGERRSGCGDSSHRAVRDPGGESHSPTAQGLLSGESQREGGGERRRFMNCSGCPEAATFLRRSLQPGGCLLLSQPCGLSLLPALAPSLSPLSVARALSPLPCGPPAALTPYGGKRLWPSTSSSPARSLLAWPSRATRSNVFGRSDLVPRSGLGTRERKHRLFCISKEVRCPAHPLGSCVLAKLGPLDRQWGRELLARSLGCCRIVGHLGEARREGVSR